MLPPEPGSAGAFFLLNGSFSIPLLPRFFLFIISGHLLCSIVSWGDCCCDFAPDTMNWIKWMNWSEVKWIELKWTEFSTDTAAGGTGVVIEATFEQNKNWTSFKSKIWVIITSKYWWHKQSVGCIMNHQWLSYSSSSTIDISGSDLRPRNVSVTLHKRVTAETMLLLLSSSDVSLWFLTVCETFPCWLCLVIIRVKYELASLQVVSRRWEWCTQQYCHTAGSYFLNEIF